MENSGSTARFRHSRPPRRRPHRAEPEQASNTKRQQSRRETSHRQHDMLHHYEPLPMQPPTPVHPHEIRYPDFVDDLTRQLEILSQLSCLQSVDRTQPRPSRQAEHEFALAMQYGDSEREEDEHEEEDDEIATSTLAQLNCGEPPVLYSRVNDDATLAYGPSQSRPSIARSSHPAIMAWARVASPEAIRGHQHHDIANARTHAQNFDDPKRGKQKKRPHDAERDSCSVKKYRR